LARRNGGGRALGRLTQRIEKGERVSVAVADTPEDSGADPIGLILAMVRVATPDAGRHVHRLLAAELAGLPTARELRLAELGFLKSMLPDSPDDRCEFTTCERATYDELRPTTAPSSRHLVDQYGSWSRACRAAYSLDEDGSPRAAGKPWPTTNRGKPHELFTQDELLAAVRQCAEELRAAGLVGRPTSWQFDEWVRRRKLEARRRGQDIRLPTAKAIYLQFRHMPHGRSRWQAILDLAAVACP
jgi:hypothetical protein